MSQAIHNATNGLLTGNQKLSTIVVKSGPSFLTLDSERDQDTISIVDSTYPDDNFHDLRNYRG